MLEDGPISEGDSSQELHSEALAWASNLGASQAAGLTTLDIDAPEMSGLPTLRTHLSEHWLKLRSWLDSFCPEDERENSLPTLMRNLRSLTPRRGYDPASETFLVVPTRQMRSFRIGPTDYILTRDLVNTRDVFARWTKHRHRMPTESISSVLGRVAV